MMLRQNNFILIGNEIEVSERKKFADLYFSSGVVVMRIGLKMLRIKGLKKCGPLPENSTNNGSAEKSVKTSIVR